jgi:hypothetical protein
MSDPDEMEEVGAEQGAVKREQSTIAFPYHDLEAGIEAARALYNRSGLGTCDLDELAAEMGLVISGAFRVRVAAVKTFGLIEKDGRSSVKLSDLGRRIISEGAKAAKVEAFLTVPLYAAVYDQYKGQKLPPMKALEREMQALGVSAKVADRARQAFERSAKQAGFFDAGDDRLVRPRLENNGLDQRDRQDDASPPQERPRPPAPQREEVPSGKDHPLIQGLLITLPEPGGVWDPTGRQAWLTMAGSIFDMIYKLPSASSQGTRSDG